MFALPVFTVIAALAGYAAAESHQVTMTNKCGSGSPVFLYEADGNPQGPATVNGQLLGGVAWLDGFSGADCLNSGVNCGIVEFTLRNDAPNQNAADFSFQTQGNHQYVYNMAFNYFGACTESATCTSATCPGAFTGSNTEDGAPVQCIGSDVGINIVFCP
ncbi:uncharacterized protein STEHIDRAFT_118719 [Stereum hirsutum FP-91666 SS1]|uniref:uncharacterized protein n=1 Tax=Stereum hirsutum (strain FP-91666) TaxID=721885 RepID=UPI000440C2F7|nr:uncharacterized protein STEHIDRAFT_118719 [Stereum hirsutum FP-91666 SS1]EIM89530.1 hypothetical protein STEHIDRAFT_118719 [Stereum hirsutum FP-91666 SS1]